MAVPWEKEEYKKSAEWSKKAKAGELNVKNCISGWIDICGFGSALERSKWDLVQLQKNGLLNLLSLVYQRVAHPFWVGVDPMPYETILVINDGVARTIDLDQPLYTDARLLIFYLREIIWAHSNLIKLTSEYGYGVRTILAGGERVQYSPDSFTGHSLLQHDENNISEFGKALLAKNFLHNPIEFQMNTAFAKAYSIDSLGSKKGFEVNHLYIESSFFEKLHNIPFLEIVYNDSSILLLYRSKPAFEIYFKNSIYETFKGLEMKVYEIEKMRIDTKFEGEETIFEIPTA